MAFFELLRSSLGMNVIFPALSEEQWEYLYDLAKKQALVGFLYKGIEKLPRDKRPPKRVLLKWYSHAERIKKMNGDVYKACVYIGKMYQEAGLKCCVLKGQGNAMMYEDPYSRTSGDIDLWVDSAEVTIENGNVIIGENKLRVGRQVYHHFDVEKVQGVDVEIHTRPSFMNNLFHNKRIQKWFRDNSAPQFENVVELPDGMGTISIPLPEFNIVYQLAHISKHVFQDGIGLRQFVDYWFVLKSVSVDHRNYAKLLKRLGLYKVAQAVMYVEHHALGLDEKFLIVPENERYGKFLLNEIMISGNFGKYDMRIDDFHRNTGLGRNLERFKRDMRLMALFPSECLWEPVFRGWHYFWRLKNT